MKSVIQRVKSAKVIVDKNTIGSINKGIVAFIGITNTDGLKQIE
jgi:D-Tyr-tRNAtyr deacylase